MNAQIIAPAAHTDQVRLRLANYYLGRLQVADTAYRRGLTDTTSITLLNQEWLQIVQWQSWAASLIGRNDEAARLCAAYPQLGAEILITRQTPEERIRWLEAGLAAARAIHDAEAEVQCLFHMAWAVHKQAQLERAGQLARETLARAEALQHTLLIGQSLHLLGEIAVRQGDFRQAEAIHMRSYALLQQIDAHAALANVAFSLAEHAYYRGDYAAARDYSWQCYQVQYANGMNLATTNNLTCLGMFTAEAGDLAAGEAFVQQSIALCRASSTFTTLAHALKVWAGLLMIRQEWQQALDVLDESMALAEQIGEAWLIPDILIFRARVYARTDHQQQAIQDAADAVNIARTTGYRLTLLEALVSQADVLVRAGDDVAAAAMLHESFALAQQLPVVSPLLYGLYAAAQVYHQRGQIARAAELVGHLTAHPGTEALVRVELVPFAAMLNMQLGNDAYAAAFAQGSSNSAPLSYTLEAVSC